MGNVDRLLEHHREEVLGVLDECVEGAWNQGLQLRSSMIEALGNTRGFDLKPNYPWKRASAGLRLGLRRASRDQLKRIAGAIALAGIPERVTLFREAVNGPSEPAPDDGSDHTEDRAPASEQWIEALERLDASHHHHFVLFASCLADQLDNGWAEGARSAIDTVYERGFKEAESETAQPVEAEPAEVEPADSTSGTDDSTKSLPASRAQELTPVDRVFIDLIIQSADAQHGSKSADEIGKIINEFAALNAMRHQSRFHLGFHAALTDVALPERTGAENDQRRAWRVAGWLTGHLRREGNSAYARFESLSESDKAALVSQPLAARTIGDRFIEALIQSDRAKEVARWIPFSSPGTLRRILGYCHALTREGRAGESVALPTVIAAVSGYVIDDPDERAELLLECGIVTSRAYRSTGRFDLAADACDDCARTYDRYCDDSERSGGFTTDEVERLQLELTAERLFISARVRDIESLWFAEGRSPQSIGENLHGAAETFRKLTESDSKPSAGIVYCIAMWCLLCPTDPECAPATKQCTEWLNDLIVNSGAIRVAGMPDRVATRLWAIRALLLARDGGPTIAACVADLATYESAHGPLPFDVIRDAIESALAEDAANVDQLIVPRLATDLQNLTHSGLLKSAVQNPRVIARLRDDLPTLAHKLPRQDAVIVVTVVFAALAENGGRSPDLRAIGDELIALVYDYSDGAPEAIATLERNNRGPSIWGDDDYCAISYQLALHCGDRQRDETRQRLMRRAHVLIDQHPEDAEECLEMAERLGEPRESCDGPRKAIEKQLAMRRTANAGAGSQVVRRVRVLFVGGDERQRQEQENVKMLVAARRRNVEIEFEHPGWGSNWGPKLDAAIRKLAQADIVVMLRFTRTIYGEKLRHAISASGKQWRPTYGHGAPAIARAIASAANEFAG